MDKKELKKQKDLYVAVKKKFITGLAELKSEGETEIAQQIAERLNAFVVGKMNPRSMVDRIRIQDGLPNSVFKQYFHDQLRQDLRNKVLYSAVKCRRKRSATPYHFTTTYMINNADGLREFLPALFEPVIGHGADYSIIIVDMDWAREFTIKYNWDEQEVILEFVVKRFHVASLDPNGGVTGCYI
jgi:hypothetical protein